MTDAHMLVKAEESIDSAPPPPPPPVANSDDSMSPCGVSEMNQLDIEHIQLEDPIAPTPKVGKGIRRRKVKAVKASPVEAQKLKKVFHKHRKLLLHSSLQGLVLGDEKGVDLKVLNKNGHTYIRHTILVPTKPPVKKVKRTTQSKSSTHSWGSYKNGNKYYSNRWQRPSY